MKDIKQVKHFMKAANQQVLEKIPADAHYTKEFYDTIILRIRLLFEELKELATACGRKGTDVFAVLCQSFLMNEIDYIVQEQKGTIYQYNWNPTEVLDALIDLRYVLNGAVLSLGFEEIFDEAFEIVHANNMTKFVTSQAEIDETIAAYELKNDPITIEQNVPGLFACKDKYGKLRKPVGYRNVKLDSIVSKHYM